MPEPYLTMADIAAVYRVTERTARRWAADGRWRRTTSRPVRYSLADAQASRDKRRASHPRPSLRALDNSDTMRAI